MLTALTFLLVANTPVPIELPPPTALALDIAEAIGATTRKLQLTADATVSPAETDALADALRRTGLFDLKADPPTAVVRLRRVDAAALLATVEKPAGERVWVGRALWPETPDTETPDTETPKTETPKTDRVVLDRAAEYRRRRLKVASVATTAWARPILPFGELGDEPRARGANQAGDMAKVSSTTSNWVLMRGSAQVLDELEFARLIQDHDLERAVAESRYDTRLRWVLGFGGAALVAAAAGTGLYLGAPADNPQLHTDLQTVGVSALVLGVASAVVALFFPTVGTEPIQSPADAELRCDAHNARLMRQLHLAAEDLVIAPPATTAE